MTFEIYKNRNVRGRTEEMKELFRQLSEKPNLAAYSDIEPVGAYYYAKKLGYKVYVQRIDNHQRWRSSIMLKPTHPEETIKK